MNLNKTLLEKFVDTILLMEGRKDESVSVVYVEDGYMRGLNRNFRRSDTTTDVLAFDLAIEVKQRDGKTYYNDTLGEVYVSADRAISQAKDYGVSVSEEVARLTAHGVLHLLGYRDENRKERTAMKRQEDILLRQFGDLALGVARVKKAR
ncbi:MAG: rRNA maturation RNase YbeY [Candidatus Eisenbacteria bacterium]|nr:rRNA maturation RNase YbeY [Candidatus Eisenbacteria bacterium]